MTYSKLSNAGVFPAIDGPSSVVDAEAFIASLYDFCARARALFHCVKRHYFGLPQLIDMNFAESLNAAQLNHNLTALAGEISMSRIRHYVADAYLALRHRLF